MNSNRNTLGTSTPPSITSPPSIFTLPTFSESSSHSADWGVARTPREQPPCSTKVAIVLPRQRQLPHVTISGLKSWRNGRCPSTLQMRPRFVVNREKEQSSVLLELLEADIKLPSHALKITFRQKLGAYWVLYKEKMPGVHGLPRTVKEFALSNNVNPFGVYYHVKVSKHKSTEELLEIVNTPSQEERSILLIDNFNPPVHSHAPFPKKIWMNRYELEHHPSQD